MKKPSTKPTTTPNPAPDSAQPQSNPAQSQSTPPDHKDTQIAELIADLQRTRADFENFRKNVEKDRETAKKLARESTVAKFLPLLDDLDRAIQVYKELTPLTKSFEKSLTSLGLTKINTQKGTEFDPNLHEAVMSEGSGTQEIITETLRPGYLYEGEVIRPAMVKITLK